VLARGGIKSCCALIWEALRSFVKSFAVDVQEVRKTKSAEELLLEKKFVQMQCDLFNTIVFVSACWSVCIMEMAHRGFSEGSEAVFIGFFNIWVDLTAILTQMPFFFFFIFLVPCKKFVTPATLDVYCVIHGILHVIVISAPVLMPIAHVYVYAPISVFSRILIGTSAKNLSLNVAMNFGFEICVFLRMGSSEHHVEDYPIVRSGIQIMALYLICVTVARKFLMAQARVATHASSRKRQLHVSTKLLNVLYDAVVELDDQLQCAEGSHQLSALLFFGQKSPESLIGTPFHQLCPAEERDRVRTAFLGQGGDVDVDEDAMSDTDPSIAGSATFNTRLQDISGSHFEAEVVYVTFLDAENRKRYLVGIREVPEAAAAVAPAPLKRAPLKMPMSRHIRREHKKKRETPPGTPGHIDSADLVSNSSSCSLISTSVLASDRFAPTKMEGKCRSLEKVVRSWNSNFSSKSCCNMHAAYHDAIAVARMADFQLCKPSFKPVGAWQCEQCGLLWKDVPAASDESNARSARCSLCEEKAREDVTIVFDFNLRVSNVSDAFADLGVPAQVGQYLGDFIIAGQTELDNTLATAVIQKLSGEPIEKTPVHLVLQYHNKRGDNVQLHALWSFTVEAHPGSLQDSMEFSASLSSIQKHPSDDLPVRTVNL